MLHYKACARTWKQKAADIALGIFGVVAAIYTTFQTVAVSILTSSPRVWIVYRNTIVDSSWHNRSLLLRLLGTVTFDAFSFQLLGFSMYGSIML